MISALGSMMRGMTSLLKLFDQPLCLRFYPLVTHGKSAWPT